MMRATTVAMIAMDSIRPTEIRVFGDKGVGEERALCFRLTGDTFDETARYKTITDTSADCGKTHRNTCANESSGYHNCVFHEKILLKTFN